MHGYFLVSSLIANRYYFGSEDQLDQLRSHTLVDLVLPINYSKLSITACIQIKQNMYWVIQVWLDNVVLGSVIGLSTKEICWSNRSIDYRP